MFIDITGERFYRLLALEYVEHPDRPNRRAWKCVCDCGNIRYMESWALRNGRNRSCGCWRIEQTIARSIKHGQARRRKQTPQYMHWKNLRSRRLTNLDFAVWQPKDLKAVQSDARQISVELSAAR